MKKIKTLVAAVIMLVATCAFAAPTENVSAVVKAAFEKNFTGAAKVSWEMNEGFYFATFHLNAGEIKAAYNENGELLGVSREISVAQLPLNVSLAISNKYEGYQVTSPVTELTYGGSTSYNVTVSGKTQVLELKCSSSGDITVVRKTKK